MSLKFLKRSNHLIAPFISCLMMVEKSKPFSAENQESLAKRPGTTTQIIKENTINTVQLIFKFGGDLPIKLKVPLFESNSTNIKVP